MLSTPVGLLVCNSVSWFLGLSADTVPIEKWGPVCAKHKSRSKLEVSIRNNTAVTPDTQVLNESCWKEKKKPQKPVVFLTLCVDWRKESWVSAFQNLKERSCPPLKSVTKAHRLSGVRIHLWQSRHRLHCEDMGFKHNIRAALDVTCFSQDLGSPCSCKSCCFFINPEPTQNPWLCESLVSLG